MSSKAPIFTRGFVLICFARPLSGSAQSLVLPAIPLLLTQMGLAAEFVGLLVGAFSLGALIVRFAVGAAVDHLGWRVFGMGGAGLLGAGCLLSGLVPFVSWEAGADGFGTHFFAVVSLAREWTGALHHGERDLTRLWNLGVTRRPVHPRGQYPGRQEWLTSA